MVCLRRMLRLSVASSCSLVNTGGEGVLQWVWLFGVAITMGGSEDLVEVNLVRISDTAEPIGENNTSCSTRGLHTA